MKRLVVHLIIVSVVYCSCKTLYGIKPQENVDEEKIRLFYYQLPIKDFQPAVADSVYVSLLKAILKEDPGQLYFHLQPLQALYFDATGKLISFHVNCNAGGFPNLKWNRNNYFDKFPPVTQTRVTENIDLNILVQGIRFSNTKKLTGDYTILIFWNLLMERQSKRLIEQVNQNLKLTNKKINLILINNDYWFMNNEHRY